MRPTGPVRLALREAAVQLRQERGGASWREIASTATWRVDSCMSVGGEHVQRGVAPKLARQTIKNMVYAGELVEVGREKRAGSPHWHALYAPADPATVETGERSVSCLNALVSGWARRGG